MSALVEQLGGLWRPTRAAFVRNTDAIVVPSKVNETFGESFRSLSRGSLKRGGAFASA